MTMSLTQGRGSETSFVQSSSELVRNIEQFSLDQPDLACLTANKNAVQRRTFCKVNKKHREENRQERRSDKHVDCKN